MLSPSPFTELGFEINNYRFAVKIPKIRLRKPKLLSRKKSSSSNPSERSSNSVEKVTTCSTRFHRRYESYTKSLDQHSQVSTDPSFTSDEWIKEFNARCKSVPKLQNESEDEEHQNFYANVPSATSTPVNCKIIPLNRLHISDSEEKRTRFLPDVSGIKIYETVDIGSDGSDNIDTSSDESNSHSSDYEVVNFKNHKMTPKTLFKPRPIRTLKSKRKH